MQTHRGFSAFLASFLLYEIIPNLWAFLCIFMFVCECVCVPFTSEMSQIYHVKCQKPSSINASHKMSKNYMNLCGNDHIWNYLLYHSCNNANSFFLQPITWMYLNMCYGLFLISPTGSLINICSIRAEQTPFLPVSSHLSHVSSPGSTLWNENTSSVQILTVNKSSVRDKCHISPCLSQRV